MFVLFQTSENLLRILNELETLLIANKTVNTEPIIISSPLIHLYVNK